MINYMLTYIVSIKQIICSDVLWRSKTRPDSEKVFQIRTGYTHYGYVIKRYWIRNCLHVYNIWAILLKFFVYTDKHNMPYCISFVQQLYAICIQQNLPYNSLLDVVKLVTGLYSVPIYVYTYLVNLTTISEEGSYLLLFFSFFFRKK